MCLDGARPVYSLLGGGGAFAACNKLKVGGLLLYTAVVPIVGYVLLYQGRLEALRRLP